MKNKDKLDDSKPLTQKLDDTQQTALSAIIKSKFQPQSTLIQEFGAKIGKLYTNHGLPIDMAIDHLSLNKEQKLSILDGACQWFIEATIPSQQVNCH